MKNGKRMKRTAAVLTACGVFMAAGIVVLAGSGYASANGHAGDTSVEVEAGFNGKNAYAKVTAQNYVDADMDAHATYYDSKNGEEISQPFSGGFDQQYYGEISVNCPEDVEIVDCDFNVIGNDGGTFSHYLYAH